MAIKASTLFSRVRSMLDDDNSVRYTEAADLVPAINSAIGYITAIFTAAFEQKKIQPFVLSELVTVWLFNPVVPNLVPVTAAKINLNAATNISPPPIFNDLVWSILGVDINPEYVVYGEDRFFDSVNRFAQRVTLEEFNYSSQDPFAPGYSAVPADFLRYCYTGPGNLFNDGAPYILIRPATVLEDADVRVAVWLLLKHAAITAGTDELLFPVNVHSLIEQKMLQYLSYQGDDERLFKITDKEVKELIQLMN